MNSQLIDLLKVQAIFQSGQTSFRTFFFITVVDQLNTYFPKTILPYLTSLCSSRHKEVLQADVQTPKSEILFERQKEEKNSKNTFFQQRMDSVVHTISKIQGITKLLSITQHDYLPNEFELIKVEDDIYFQLLEVKHFDGLIEFLKFKIVSYNHESLFLQNFVESCISTYDRHMLNKLGTNKFYFNMMVQKKARNTVQNPLPTTHIMFTKHKFVTSRTFNNVFFEECDFVREHTEFFLKNREWYQSKGIPYTLGFMFHGEPGCGKTSTIKAIANIGKRHIINIHLSEIKSKEQLTHLFFNDEINVWDNGKTERYNIPVTERMYVIEDIDAMGDTVLRREWKKPDGPKKVELDQYGEIKEDESNPIDLSFLLNILDGTLETEGRIIAITTNFPERIDRALIRPGRIDMIINFKKCSTEIVQKMTNSFYDLSLDIGRFDKSLDYKWSPAEVNQILFRNIKDSRVAINELHTLNQNDLYGFNIKTQEPLNKDE
jgi:ATP-dependent 26S proteasome regulatory subunit